MYLQFRTDANMEILPSVPIGNIHPGDIIAIGTVAKCTANSSHPVSICPRCKVIKALRVSSTHGVCADRAEHVSVVYIETCHLRACFMDCSFFASSQQSVACRFASAPSVGKSSLKELSLCFCFYRDLSIASPLCTILLVHLKDDCTQSVCNPMSTKRK